MTADASDDDTRRDAFVDDHLPADLRARMDRRSWVICEAGPGTPVLHVSGAFEAHTGYRLADVVGRSLSLLHGPATERASIEKFRRLIAERRAGEVRITNYRRDGSAFVHECALRPVHAPDGRTAYFVAVQQPVAE